jgi:hypothetical protein
LSDGQQVTRKERLRRVVLLCCHFARNLAYYRSELNGKRLARNTEFWRTVNGNFLDVCVLEWCKLFGDKHGEHHWRRIVSDTASFETGLLSHLRINAIEFEKHIEEIRRYRDKFVAHLDSGKVMQIPTLDLAKTSVWFYHAYTVNNEAKADDLDGLPQDITRYHQHCADEGYHAYGASGGEVG